MTSKNRGMYENKILKWFHITQFIKLIFFGIFGKNIFCQNKRGIVFSLNMLSLPLDSSVGSVDRRRVNGCEFDFYNAPELSV